MISPASVTIVVFYNATRRMDNRSQRFSVSFMLMHASQFRVCISLCVQIAIQNYVYLSVESKYVPRCTLLNAALPLNWLGNWNAFDFSQKKFHSQPDYFWEHHPIQLLIYSYIRNTVGRMDGWNAFVSVMHSFELERRVEVKNSFNSM